MPNPVSGRGGPDPREENGGEVGLPDFRKMFKTRENWNSEYKKWSSYKKENSRFRTRKFCRMLVKIWKKWRSGKIEILSTKSDQCTRRKFRSFGSGNCADCFKIASTCLKMLQHASMLQNIPNCLEFSKLLQNATKCFSECFKMPQNCSNCFKIP